MLENFKYERELTHGVEVDAEHPHPIVGEREGKLPDLRTGYFTVRTFERKRLFALHRLRLGRQAAQPNIKRIIYAYDASIPPQFAAIRHAHNSSHSVCWVDWQIVRTCTSSSRIVNGPRPSGGCAGLGGSCPPGVGRLAAARAAWGRRGVAPMTTRGRPRPRRWAMSRTTCTGWTTQMIAGWACRSATRRSRA